YRGVAETGRQLGDAELLARAAIGIENGNWRVALLDENTILVLEEGLAALDPADSTLRGLLLSGLGRARARGGPRQRTGGLRDQAIAMARRLDYREGLPVVLMRAYWARGSDDMDTVLELVTEARTIADEVGDIEVQAEASEWRIAALIAKGDLCTAAVELAE